MRSVYDRRTRAYLSRCVADAFLAGVWNERAMVARVGRSLDSRPAWMLPVAREVLAAYHRPIGRESSRHLSPWRWRVFRDPRVGPGRRGFVAG
jgi:hypothetical protein